MNRFKIKKQRILRSDKGAITVNQKNKFKIKGKGKTGVTKTVITMQIRTA
jgi:hypothetical protein